MTVSQFFKYAQERYVVKTLKEDGFKKPWTQDSILQQYRFCNIFREDDTVTKWIDENIRKPYADHEHLWFMLCIARTINHTDTLQELIDSYGAWPSHSGFHPATMGEVLQARKDRGEQVYTGAYMIRAESNPKAEWYTWTKQHYIAGIVLGRLWDDRRDLSDFFEFADSLQMAFEVLYLTKEYIGWGPFMSYEVITDLRYTRYLNEASDILTWANAGPGCARGLGRIFFADKNRFKYGSKYHQLLMNAGMQALLLKSEQEKYWPQYWPQWEMRDVEHTLCEFDKYERVRLGEGRPRSLYNGKGET